MMDAMFSPEDKLHSSSDTVSANLSAFKKKKEKSLFESSPGFDRIFTLKA